MMQRLMFFSLFLLLIGSTTVEAKWWIFGQSQDEVATRFIYLNDISYDELGDQVTLYRDMLPAGRVEIRGRGQSGKNRIGAAEVSLDGGQSWQKIELSRDGSFYFRFTPDINREYDLALRLLDTSGKSNEVDDTRKKLTVSDRDIQSMIRDVLDAMITAYQFKNERDFMVHVDPDFAGDAMILERAIQKDFTLLDQISMRYTLNSVVSGSGGKVFAALKFNRKVTESRTGKVFSDEPTTEFTFTLRGHTAKVSAMKKPLIFGISEEESVATGEVNQPGNDDTLGFDDNGDLCVGCSEDEGGPGGGSDSASNVPTPTNMRVTDAVPHHMYSFAFDFPINSMDVDLSGTYWIVLEESLSPDGPWTEIFREEFWDPRFGNISTDAIAQFGVFLYYRAKVESQDTGEQSLPTNVVEVDNR